MSAGPESLNELLQAAKELVRRGKRQEALENYRKALELSPGDKQIRERINALEREIAAMEKFYKSRTSRVHSAGRSISSSSFVEECLERSREALEEGDTVRAMQELERAKRHDPDNERVTARIEHVRSLILTEKLEDAVRNSLKSDDPVAAVENLRKIFDIMPSALVLGELLDLVEEYGGTTAAVVKERQDSPAETPVPAAVPEKKTSGEPERKKTFAPAKSAPVSTVKPMRSTRRRERKKGGGKKVFMVASAVLLAAVAVIAGISIFGGGGEDVGIPAPQPPEPYTETLVVPGIDDVSVICDGEPVAEGLKGVFVISDTLFGERSFTISAPGYETRIWRKAFTEGVISTDTVMLDTLGTSTVKVTFDYRVPQGMEAPGPEAVSYLVDGEPVEGDTMSLKTGHHVFEAVAEGYRTLPESILVVEPENFTHVHNVMPAEQSQITIRLSDDTPGNAMFYVDGDRVATGRRMSEAFPLGGHSIRISAPGYDDYVFTVNLGEEGYDRTVSLRKTVETGRLVVGPEPWSDVYIDGRHVGTTPFGGVDLEPGTYTVTLKNPDFLDDVHQVEIAAGETTRIQFNAVVPEREEAREELPVSQPFPVSQTTPTIPSQARARGDIHGFVTLSVVVGADGKVKDVTIVDDPLGLGCGRAARDAVMNWVFQPAMQGDRPVEATTTVSVRFDIE